jgi:hypothetical protein
MQVRNANVPTIIESCPIDLNLGPVHVTGWLFVAAPPMESFVEGELAVLGIVQKAFRLVITEKTVSIDLTIHEAFFTLSMHFDIPTGSFLCQLQPKDAEKQAQWHVLATVPA